MKTSEIEKLAAIPRPSRAEQQAMHLYTAARLFINTWFEADDEALVMASAWLSKLAEELPRPVRANAAAQLAELVCSLVVEQPDDEEQG